jgi:hypothetical protein
MKRGLARRRRCARTATGATCAARRKGRAGCRRGGGGGGGSCGHLWCSSRPAPLCDGANKAARTVGGIPIIWDVPRCAGLFGNVLQHLVEQGIVSPFARRHASAHAMLATEGVNRLNRSAQPAAPDRRVVFGIRARDASFARDRFRARLRRSGSPVGTCRCAQPVIHLSHPSNRVWLRNGLRCANAIVNRSSEKSLRSATLAGARKRRSANDSG